MLHYEIISLYHCALFLRPFVGIRLLSAPSYLLAITEINVLCLVAQCFVPLGLCISVFANCRRPLSYGDSTTVFFSINEISYPSKKNNCNKHPQFGIHSYLAAVPNFILDFKQKPLAKYTVRISLAKGNDFHNCLFTIHTSFFCLYSHEFTNLPLDCEKSVLNKWQNSKFM